MLVTCPGSILVEIVVVCIKIEDRAEVGVAV